MESERADAWLTTLMAPYYKLKVHNNPSYSTQMPWKHMACLQNSGACEAPNSTLQEQLLVANLGVCPTGPFGGVSRSLLERSRWCVASGCN